jgi:hypothetical protein
MAASKAEIQAIVDAVVVTVTAAFEPTKEQVAKIYKDLIEGDEGRRPIKETVRLIEENKTVDKANDSARWIAIANRMLSVFIGAFIVEMVGLCILFVVGMIMFLGERGLVP